MTLARANPRSPGQRARRILLVGLACLFVVGALAPESRAEEPRAKPDFALRDTDGVTRRLSTWRGKWVVLEWVDFDCAPVREHYKQPERRMQQLQRAYRAKGVVWLSINSAAVGARGHLTAAQGKSTLTRLGAMPSALLLDPTGSVGKQFRVRVTPEVRLISPRGDVVYAGAVEGAVGSAGAAAQVPYLQRVLAAATRGERIPFAAQAAHGCPIRYATSATPGPAATATGPKAPDFTLTDSAGVVRSLADYRGKWVILEWVNYDCPFVQKHYHSSHRSMQTLQRRSAQRGIVWLSICSSARGKQGFFSPAQANARMRRLGATPTAYLHDPTGAVGRSYGARTTPDMRVITPQGTIAYAGSIDSIPSARAGDVARAKNYVAMALADIAARRPIAVKKSRPYGCSVKY